MSHFDPGLAFDRVVQTRAGGAVQRCHGIRHSGSYSNAEHTWGVLVLMWHIYPEHFIQAAPYALFHDVPEFIFGDVPAPSMRYVPGLREQLGRLEDRFNTSLGNPPEGDLQQLAPRAFAALKSCDRLELWFWCVEQRSAGNMFAHECEQELRRYFEEENGLDERGMKFYKTALVRTVLPRQAGVAKRIAEELE